MRKAVWALVVSGVVNSFSASASANGRFPASNAMVFAPSNPDLILLRVSFGLLVSRDRGKTWDWVCEGALGLAGIEDPMYTITPDNTLLASTFQGLAISPDGACSFLLAGGPLAEQVFIDVAARPTDRANVLAFASSYGGQSDAGEIFFRSTLFETKDQGKSFAALGTGFDSTILGETVDFTATDPNRIYVSAVRNPGTKAAALLLTSRDYGKAWEEHPIALVGEERAAYIAAVDPKNADRVYLRTLGSADKPSRIILTDDAGKTFRTVFTGQSALAGFALSPDGSKIWVGSMKDGVQMANTTDFAFQQRSKVEIQCLAMSADGLWACSNERSGFVAGLSTDEGATFEKKLAFCDIRGPLACGEGTTTRMHCGPGATATGGSEPWPLQRASLGCGGAELDAGVPDAGAPAAAPSGEGDGGCSVHTRTTTPVAALAALLAASVALFGRRKRR